MIVVDLFGPARTEWEDTPALPERPGWQAQANCRGMGTDLFFPSGSGTFPEADFQRLRVLCGSCPVAEQCLQYGLNDRHGVWGGLTETGRRRLRKTRT